MMTKSLVLLWACSFCLVEAFQVPIAGPQQQRLPQQHHVQHRVTSLLLSSSSSSSTATSPEEDVLGGTDSSSSSSSSSSTNPKQQLLGLLGRISSVGVVDPVLADPFTKEPIRISSPGPLLADNRGGNNIRYVLKSSSNTYEGNSNSFWNLLEPIPVATATTTTTTTTNSSSSSTSSTSSTLPQTLARNLVPFIPPPLRSALATAGLDMGEEYVPMRDLFTSPAVSFAYERGWRQGFSSAGFPGADKEAQMAMEYFEPAFALQQDDFDDSPKTLVDMSCATGLFTRRFAKSQKYERVIGCDYSASMLTEARRRIQADPELSKQRPSNRLDLVQCDVGKIPMRDNSVNALHAGAAMHCWPDLPAAVSEIHRVLKPGGRYFATTFLSSWFGTLQNAEGGQAGPSRQAFQYFESVDQLRSLLEQGGFESSKISIEVLGRACVVIRCEK